MDRLKILDIKESCTGCGACANICSKNSITMQYDSEGFYMPHFDPTLCVDCRLCEKRCHIISPNIVNSYSSEAYVCWSKEDSTRQMSSSGGMFSELSRGVIADGGVVFGARYSFKDERLEHSNTDHYDISEFRKSKYIESTTLNTFRDVKQFLNDGRSVLYCGTPCQISGLRKFLGGKEYEKLLLVDFICHGVPSNMHFTEYKRYLENKKGAKLNYLDFRPKTKGWYYNNFGMGFGTKKYIKHYSHDMFYISFYSNLALRSSCYDCTMLNNKQSDITLADFWKIKKYTPELDNDKGASFLVVNSFKGNNYFHKQVDNIFSQKLPEDAISESYIRDNSKFSLNERELNLSEISRIGFVAFLKQKYSKEIRIRKIKSVIKKMIGRE